MKYEKYSHYGNEVWVKKDLKGKHREHCLCWSCGKFFPKDRVNSCPIANMVHALCLLRGLVLPVWECGVFIPQGGNNAVL